MLDNMWKNFKSLLRVIALGWGVCCPASMADLVGQGVEMLFSPDSEINFAQVAMAGGAAAAAETLAPHVADCVADLMGETKMTQELQAVLDDPKACARLSAERGAEKAAMLRQALAHRSLYSEATRDLAKSAVRLMMVSGGLGRERSLGPGLRSGQNGQQGLQAMERLLEGVGQQGVPAPISPLLLGAGPRHLGALGREHQESFALILRAQQAVQIGQRHQFLDHVGRVGAGVEELFFELPVVEQAPAAALQMTEHQRLGRR